METIKYYLKQLDEPYRAQAIENAKTSKTGVTIRLKSPFVTSVRDAVLGAFDWEDTPEGDVYWFKLSQTL